jgi:hypothetical protein
MSKQEEDRFYDAALAFAQSKPTEFDAFKTVYYKEHPLAVEPIVEPINIETFPDKTQEEVDEIRKTRKKKTTIEE